MTSNYSIMNVNFVNLVHVYFEPHEQWQTVYTYWHLLWSKHQTMTFISGFLQSETYFHLELLVFVVLEIPCIFWMTVVNSFICFSTPLHFSTRTVPKTSTWRLLLESRLQYGESVHPVKMNFRHYCSMETTPL